MNLAEDEEYIQQDLWEMNELLFCNLQVLIPLLF